MKKWTETLNKDLEFNEEKHRYLYKGEIVPGVTTVIGSQIPKPALMFWAVKMMAEYLEENLPCGVAISPSEKQVLIETGKKAHAQKKKEAADLGTLAHTWIEQHIKASLKSEPYPDMPDNELVLNAVNAFLEWENTNKVVYIASEKKLYSKDWNVAGTADILAKVNDKTALIDIKTSNGIWPEHYIQTAAYAKMLEEMESAWIDTVYVIRIGKDDGKFYEHEFSGDIRKLYEKRFGVCVEGFFLDKQLKV